MCQNQLSKPAAIALLPLGLMLVALSAFVPHFFHPMVGPNQDWQDGLRGFLTGVGTGMEIVAVILLARQRRSRGSR